MQNLVNKSEINAYTCIHLWLLHTNRFCIQKKSLICPDSFMPSTTYALLFIVYIHTYTSFIYFQAANVFHTKIVNQPHNVHVCRCLMTIVFLLITVCKTSEYMCACTYICCKILQKTLDLTATGTLQHFLSCQIISVCISDSSSFSRRPAEVNNNSKSVWTWSSSSAVTVPLAGR